MTENNVELNFFSLVNDFEVYLPVKVMTHICHTNLCIFCPSQSSTSTNQINSTISEISALILKYVSCQTKQTT